MRLDHRVRRLQGRHRRLLLLLLLRGSIQLGCKGWLRYKVLQRRYSALREEASRLHLLCLCSGLPISRCRTHGRQMLEINRRKLEARLPWVWQRLLAGQGGQQRGAAGGPSARPAASVRWAAACAGGTADTVTRVAADRPI